MRALILLPLALAACQGGAEEAANDTAAATGPVGMTPIQLRVAELPPAQRNGVLLRAIRDGAAPCQGITDANRQPDQDGKPVFAARCGDGPVYVIAVDRNGIARVTRLSDNRP